MPRLGRLWRRALLILRHEGAPALLRKVLRRARPLVGRLRAANPGRMERAQAAAWYADHARPVTVVLTARCSPAAAIPAAAAVERTTQRDKVRVVTADPAHLDTVLGRIAEETEGDVVLLDGTAVVRRGWLEVLQQTAHAGAGAGIVGPGLASPGDAISAVLRAPVLAVSSACMYIRRDALEAVGLSGGGPDGGAERDRDYCLRAWAAGYRVVYSPAARVSLRAPGDAKRMPGPRAARPVAHRPVTTPEGNLRVIYVTQDTNVSGGHRLIFEHLNRLAARGHEAELFTLGDPPEWFDLRAPVTRFADYEALVAELSGRDAIKVATWWATAEPVWVASVTRGVPVYLVQDIETSYYPHEPAARAAVLASYRPEFNYLTTSPWNQAQLAERDLAAVLVPPGVDLDTYRPLAVERRPDVVLTIGRSHHLKNLPLTWEAWRALSSPRPELWMFGVEPELGTQYGARYVTGPSDEEVAGLLSSATVFVQTSRHEGFCLPVLEAMATGTPVVCTDAHGNRDFCRDGVNCLMPEATGKAVAAALAAVLRDDALRDRLRHGGLRTAAEFGWESRIDLLEACLGGLAAAPPQPPASQGIRPIIRQETHGTA